MAITTPRARLGVVVSASNRWVEPYFRALAPDTLAQHFTRMPMAQLSGHGTDAVTDAAVESAKIVGLARPDVIDIQATGLIMAMGPEAEARLTAAVEDATGIPAYTAGQALVEALKALGVESVMSITPFDAKANADERAYLEGSGITFAGEQALNLESGPATAEHGFETWLEAARAHDIAGAQAILLGGSNTTMTEAVQPIEAALGKPAVTSVQAALWAGLKRLKGKLGDFTPDAALGRLGQTL
jgi:maleate isomerase